MISFIFNASSSRENLKIQKLALDVFQLASASTLVLLVVRDVLHHKAGDCRYMNEDVPMPTIVWRRKEIPNNEDCRIALTTEKCKEEDEWYIDSGCSSHMRGDQYKFIILKRKGGNVAFGDDSSAKILGKVVVELGSKNVKANNVLLVQDLKHNLLSVSKMCDQGYTLMFDSQI